MIPLDFRTQPNPKRNVSNDSPADIAVSFSHDPVEEFVDQFEDHKEKSDLRGKLPTNSQATTVLVGAHNSLTCTVSAFVRLATGCELGNLAEVQIPIRFMFILLGPEDNGIDYHEVGRSFATLMADKLFLQSAYMAKVNCTSNLSQSLVDQPSFLCNLIFTRIQAR